MTPLNAKVHNLLEVVHELKLLGELLFVSFSFSLSLLLFLYLSQFSVIEIMFLQ